MAYGDLSIFLPRAEGDKLNVERARAEGESRAGYLASMDQFSEELEENQRQFDITSALSERQFEWSSGFEETRLEQEGRFEQQRLGLESTRLKQEKISSDAMNAYYRNQLVMQSKESEYLMDYNTRKFELEEAQLNRTRKSTYRAPWNPWSASRGSGGGVRGGGGTGSGYRVGSNPIKRNPRWYYE